MSLRTLRRTWDNFFFAPQSTLRLGMFLIFCGAAVAATLALLQQDWLGWYGNNSWIKQPAIAIIEPGFRLNLFAAIPMSDGWIDLLFWLLILHGGDTFLRVSGFFLMFARAGAALSVDHLIRMRRGEEGPGVPSRSSWAQRMIQFELTLVYRMSFWWKSRGISRVRRVVGVCAFH